MSAGTEERSPGQQLPPALATSLAWPRSYYQRFPIPDCACQVSRVPSAQCFWAEACRPRRLDSGGNGAVGGRRPLVLPMGTAPSWGPQWLHVPAGWQEAGASQEKETRWCFFADCLISPEDFDKWRDRLLIPGCSGEGGSATANSGQESLSPCPSTNHQKQADVSPRRGFRGAANPNGFA